MTHFGLFDSGIGGLTVLKRVREAFPGCQYTYVGDSARAPYGGRPTEELWEINKGIIEFLIAQGVTHFIMACNTSCSQFLERIRQNYGLPVTGIVTSIAGVLDRHVKRVVVLATQATVNTHAYKAAIEAEYKEINVIEMACPTLVPIIERGEFNDTDTAEVKRVLALALEYSPSHIVMGCTHYPFLEEIWKRDCPSTVTLIDPAYGVIKELMREDRHFEDCGNGSVTYFVSGNVDRFKAVLGDDVSILEYCGLATI